MGLAVAHALTRAGARVVLAGTCGCVAEVASEIDARGGDAVARVADLADLEDAKRVAELALELHGRIDLWVNVAEEHAVFPDELSLDEPDLMSRHRSVVNGSLVALWHMRDTGGAILNVCADYPFAPHARALAHFTQSVRASAQKESLPVELSLVSCHAEPPTVVADRIVAAAIARWPERSWPRQVA